MTAVRAIETADRDRALWSDADRSWASRAAAEVVGEGAGSDAFVARRARLALERLSERYPPLRKAVAVLHWRRWIGVAIVALAFLAGIAIDRIGDSRQINLLAPPVIGVARVEPRRLRAAAGEPGAARSRGARFLGGTAAARDRPQSRAASTACRVARRKDRSARRSRNSSATGASAPHRSTTRVPHACCTGRPRRSLAVSSPDSICAASRSSTASRGKARSSMRQPCIASCRSRSRRARSSPAFRSRRSTS